ncbi:MAG: efflux RND transporter permease subunit [Halopseudomonas sp.]
MRFTDIFIRRPVFSAALSLLILILGIQAIFKLQVREYPELANTVITVSTAYYGAPAEVVQGFITQPVQQVVAEVDNLDFIESTSKTGLSTVTATMKIGTDSNDALAEVMAKVNSVRARLPSEAQDPSVSSATGASTSIMYISFESTEYNAAQIADYLNRNVQPKLVTVPGVAKANMYGPELAMRIWLDADKLAAHDLTASEVNRALEDNNFRSAPGQLEDQWQQFDISINTDLKSIDEFEQLILVRRDNGIVRLIDVARIEMSEVRESIRPRTDGNPAVVMAIDTTPVANPLDTAKGVRERLPDIANNLPAAIEMELMYDATVYIEASINEVLITIVEATLIVVITIFLFMGNLRAVIIPVVAIPLSLIGVCLVMQMVGFSINLLTLLAMVLAIGLVVDDAIVVVENVERHLKQGETPFRAAIIGTREIAMPVITMTITLAAVYSPIALLDGLTGTLFKEFSLTLAGAVVVSGIVALTLSPVLCAGILRHNSKPGRFERGVHRFLERLDAGYGRALAATLKRRPAIVLFALCTFASLYFLFRIIPSELAPAEDKGAVMLMANAPASANIDYVDLYLTEIGERSNQLHDVAGSLSLSGYPSTNSGLGIIRGKVWEERESSLSELIQSINELTADLAGVNTSVFPIPALPGAGSGLPIQFVVNGVGDYQTLLTLSQELFVKAQQSGLFVFSNIDLKFETPEVAVQVNRDKAGAYGVSMADIGKTLSTLIGDGYVNHINIDGRAYEVVPQAERSERGQPEHIGRYHVRSMDGHQVPLANLIDFEVGGKPSALVQMNQANSVTIGAVLMPGGNMGQAIEFLKAQADELLPPGYSYDFKGESRQFVQEGASLYITFLLALAIIFLVLAMQFESWRDAIVIMISVPLAICGALLVMAWGVTTMNIYTQIGLITLVGLITKHGILMCEVAKVQQIEQGADRFSAIHYAARIRLRPILMTTVSMVAGLIPLLLAVGPGAAARFNIGMVICAGLSIGTLFTLFVLPTIYCYIGAKHKPLQVFEEQPEV